MRSFIITGSKTKRDEFIANLIEKETIAKYSVKEFIDEIRIKDAKILRSELSLKYTEKRLIIINKINFMSQNALLKSFEELNPNIGIIISTESIGEILDTVKSRFFVVNLEQNNRGESFLASLIAGDMGKRLTIIDKFLSENAKSDAAETAKNFLLNYRNEFLENIEKFDEISLNTHLKILKNLNEAVNLIRFNNVNLRLGLESALLVK